jgi:hypothetical protein
MRKNKLNKELLNEELKKFKLMSEYAFYEDRAEPELKSGEEIILGDLNEEDPVEDEEDAGDLPFGSEDASSEESSDEKSAPEEEPEGGAEGEEGLSFGDEEGDDEEDSFSSEEPSPEEEPEEDSVELDVTELVKGSEEAKASADAANAKIDQLMQMVSKLENATKGMDAISSKIENLETEFEKRNPTEEEKLEMRSLSSAPYNLKLTDFWKDKEGIYDVMGDENKEPKEYVLTKDDIDADYNEIDAKNSIYDNPFEEDEI